MLKIFKKCYCWGDIWKIHMVFGGWPKNHVCPQGGSGDQKCPKICQHGLWMTPEVIWLFKLTYTPKQNLYSHMDPKQHLYTRSKWQTAPWKEHCAISHWDTLGYFPISAVAMPSFSSNGLSRYGEPTTRAEPMINLDVIRTFQRGGSDGRTFLHFLADFRTFKPSYSFIFITFWIFNFWQIWATLPFGLPEIQTIKSTPYGSVLLLFYIQIFVRKIERR